MSDEIKFSETTECGHCGTRTRMRILGRVSDIQEYTPDHGAPYEAGTLYEVYLCPNCKKPILAGGTWHDGMEERSDWDANIFVPDTESRTAHRLLGNHRADREFMALAVAEARKSVSERNKISPKVGAVITRGNQLVASGYRGELKEGEHAEYTVLEGHGKCKDETLAGATGVFPILLTLPS
jgi:hypothetical protein